MPFPIVKTDRLVLRQLDISDAQEIFILRSDAEINKYLGRKKSTTVEEAMSFITNINESIANNDSLYWAITIDGDSNLVGTACLFSFSEENSQCEIGYELLTQFQGQGIMKEAVEAVIAYAFDVIKVQRIEAFFHKDNLRSVSLLDKLSFRNSDETDAENPDLIGYYLVNPVDSLP